MAEISGVRRAQCCWPELGATFGAVTSINDDLASFSLFLPVFFFDHLDSSVDRAFASPSLRICEMCT